MELDAAGLGGERDRDRRTGVKRVTTTGTEGIAAAEGEGGGPPTCRRGGLPERALRGRPPNGGTPRARATCRGEGRESPRRRRHRGGGREDRGAWATSAAGHGPAPPAAPPPAAPWLARDNPDRACRPARERRRHGEAPGGAAAVPLARPGRRHGPRGRRRRRPWRGCRRRQHGQRRRDGGPAQASQPFACAVPGANA